MVYRDDSVPKQNENEPFDTTKLNLLMAYLSKTKNVIWELAGYFQLEIRKRLSMQTRIILIPRKT